MNAQKSLNFSLISHRRERAFGRIEKDRILNLMLLKTHCLSQDDRLRAAFDDFGGYAMSFYVAIVGAVDCLLHAQIKDEAVDCLERGGPVGELLADVVDDARERGLPASSIAASVADMESLFGTRHGFVVGSFYEDFVVSTFSAFEMFMARIYEPLRVREPSSESRLEALKKLIAKYNDAQGDAKEKALARIAKNSSDYVSGRQKIEFVLARLPKETQRDRAKDLQVVQFYGDSRNSIHNLGRNGSGKDLKYQSDGIDLRHAAGGGLFSKDRSDIVRLCRKLVDIFSDVVAENLDLDQEIFLATA